MFSPKRPALDAAEQQELSRLAAIVDRHVADYAAVGLALREIRDRRLYRATHDSFEEFTREHWSIDRIYADRLIAAADVARNLMPTGSIPKTERQARPLTTLEPADQVAAWSEAKAIAGDELTAAIVEAAAEKRRPRKKHRRPKPIRIKVPSGLVIIQPGKAFAGADLALGEAIAKLSNSQSDRGRHAA